MSKIPVWPVLPLLQVWRETRIYSSCWSAASWSRSARTPGRRTASSNCRKTAKPFGTSPKKYSSETRPVSAIFAWVTCVVAYLEFFFMWEQGIYITRRRGETTIKLPFRVSSVSYFARAGSSHCVSDPDILLLLHCPLNNNLLLNSAHTNTPSNPQSAPECVRSVGGMETSHADTAAKDSPENTSVNPDCVLVHVRDYLPLISCSATDCQGCE